MTETGLIRRKRLKENPIKEKWTCLQMHFLVPLLFVLMASFLPKLIEALLSIPSSSLARLEQTPLCFTVESVFMCVHVHTCMYVKTRGEYWAPSLFLLTLFCERMSPTQPRARWSRYAGRQQTLGILLSLPSTFGINICLFLLNPDARNLNSGPHGPYLQNPLHISQKQLEEGQFWEWMDPVCHW